MFKTEQTILKASVADESTETKVDIQFLDNKGICTWSADDSFNAFNEEGQKVVYKISPQDAGKQTASFYSASGDINATYAVYPSWLENKKTGSAMNIKLPDEYTVDTHSQNSPMLGAVSGGQVTFHHVMGMVRINLQNLPKGSNSIKIVTDAPISGTFVIPDIHLSENILTPDNSIRDQKKEILIHHNNQSDPFYVPLPVGTYKQIRVYTVGSTEKQIFETTNKTVERGKIYRINKDCNDTQDDFTILKNNILTENKQSPASSTVKSLLQGIQSDGSFSGINYAKQAKPAKWAAGKHLDNLETLASAYIDKSNTQYYGNEELHANIEKALNFWVTKKPEDWNWWSHQVKEGKSLGLILLKMTEGTKKLDSKLENEVISLMISRCGDPNKQEGANRADIATHWIYRACVTKDKSVLNTAINSVFSTVCYTNEEGFQTDGSFFQHGPQLYVGGYGEEILKSVTLISTLVRGTTFSLPQEKVVILRNFLLGTFFPSMRGGYMSYSVMGRSVSRPGTINKKKFSLTIAERMKQIDPEYANEYQTIMNRLTANNPSLGVSSYHKHFYRADYTLHVRANYLFDVRMVSKYTSRVENGNGENLKGYFLADGSNNILVKGNEYYDLMPVWKWAQIPGVTAPNWDNNNIPRPSEWGTRGSSTFAGGVSDGVYGASAYDYYDSFSGINTGTRKSWFFFDDEIVCLGYLNNGSENTITTVNQCLSEGAISIQWNDGTISNFNEAQTNLSNPKWIYHNQIGYVFPTGGNVWVSNENQSGNWKSINTGKSADNISKKVFALGVKHIDSSTRSYAYIVVPGITSSASLNQYTDTESPIQIVHNNKELQSVYHSGLQIWQTVFFRAGNIAKCNGISLKADRKCIVMMKKVGTSYKLYVADPSRTLSEVNLDIETANHVKKHLNIRIPNATEELGKTQEVTIEDL